MDKLCFFGKGGKGTGCKPLHLSEVLVTFSKRETRTLNVREWSVTQLIFLKMVYELNTGGKI